MKGKWYSSEVDEKMKGKGLKWYSSEVDVKMKGKGFNSKDFLEFEVV